MSKPLEDDQTSSARTPMTSTLPERIVQIATFGFVPQPVGRLAIRYLLIVVLVWASFGLLPELPALVLSLIVTWGISSREARSDKISSIHFRIIGSILVIVHFVAAVFLWDKSLRSDPDLSLAFTCSKSQDCLLITVVNANPGVVAETPRVEVAEYSRVHPKEVSQNRILMDEMMPPFLWSRAAPIPAVNLGLPEGPERMWQRRYVYLVVTCKNSPKSRGYWVGLGDTCWVSEIELPATFSADSLACEPPDRYVDAIIPNHSRLRIPFIE